MSATEAEPVHAQNSLKDTAVSARLILAGALLSIILNPLTHSFQ